MADTIEGDFTIRNSRSVETDYRIYATEGQGEHDTQAQGGNPDTVDTDDSPNNRGHLKRVLWRLMVPGPQNIRARDTAYQVTISTL